MLSWTKVRVCGDLYNAFWLYLHYAFVNKSVSISNVVLYRMHFDPNVNYAFLNKSGGISEVKVYLMYFDHIWITHHEQKWQNKRCDGMSSVFRLHLMMLLWSKAMVNAIWRFKRLWLSVAAFLALTGKRPFSFSFLRLQKPTNFSLFLSFFLSFFLSLPRCEGRRKK